MSTIFRMRNARSLLFAPLVACIFAATSSAADSLPLAGYASQNDPPSFDTPELAVQAFTSTIRGGDFNKLAELFGLDAGKAGASEGAMDTYDAIKAGVDKKVLVEDVEERKIIEIGDQLWPLPFPIVRREDGKWAFDTYGGLQEIANRHVGENELHAIATMRAYVEAQEEYASSDHDGDGVLEYAQRLISSADARDGLYWPADTGGIGQSPAGPALADGAVLAKAKAGEGYFGYRYQILTRQGDNIAGGKFDYVINGNMIGGFGLVAWPVNYGSSGQKTFVLNRNGIVYEADLGEKTADIASKMRQFNPNDNWQVVND